MESERKVAMAGEEEVLCDDQPLSPTGQYFSSSAISISILGVFEYEDQVNPSAAITLLKNAFLPINHRFSSIMITDEKGVRHFRTVTVKVEDHVKVSILPDGLSPEAYSIHLQEYMSKISMEQLPKTRPLWELHIFNYPTSSNAVSTSIFKLHHALGDGYSLMGAILSCARRADDPSLPLTFPCLRSVHKEGKNIYNRLLRYSSIFLTTTLDFVSSFLKSTVVVDDLTPIRSGRDDLEYRPFMISTTTFSLDHIKQIKAKLGGTLNDIMVGTIFYGTRLYMQSVRKDSNLARSTALVLLNTRAINEYRTVEEMVKPNTEAPWGNKFAFLHVPIPECKDTETEDPLTFISETKKTMERKKRSLAVYLTGGLLEMIRKLSNPETVSRCIYRALRNVSVVISNVRGPIEQITLANYRCNGMYFVVVNAPQTLEVTMMSYMGKLRVTIGAEKDYVDHQLLVSCIENAFRKVYQAALTTKT